MTGEIEATGDALTGAVIARTVEGAAGAPSVQGSQGACLNCGAALNGAYCASCGQPARIHRSLGSLGHDILHGVFHFEGKFWLTIPELLFHPGRLTRRYIDGERAKFVSPMALFLFTVFATFAVFSILPDSEPEIDTSNVMTLDKWRRGQESAIEVTDQKIAALEEKMAAPDATPDVRAQLQTEIAELKDARKVMEALATGDPTKIAELKQQQEKNAEAAAKSSIGFNFNSGWPLLDRKLNEGAVAAKENPELLFYKIKTNSYKFSWMLIPLSLPLMWLLFFWRSDVHLYDHAIFVTYSLSFMMIMMILLAILDAVNVGALAWGIAVFAAPLHLYKHLRGTYGLSRFGAFVRLCLLLIGASIVLSIFFLLLLVIGVLG